MNTNALNRAIQFVLSTFMLTFTSWFIFLFAHNQYGVKVFDDSPFGIFMLIGLFSPSLMGIIFRLKDGSVSMKSVSVKTLKILPLSFILPVLFVLLDTGLPKVLASFMARDFALLKMDFISLISINAIALAFAMSVIFGGLEELGWRAYLLPQLLKIMSPFKANLSVAVIWSLWHLPLFYLPGSAQYQQNFYVFTMSLISLSAIMTLLWVKTQSVVIAVLCHTTFNTTAVLGFASTNSLTQALVSTVIAVLSCISLKYVT